MKVIIPGGSGYLGQAIAERLRGQGHQVLVLTRSPRGPHELAWDGQTLGPWAQEIDGADVVINLAGRSVNCRYNVRNLREILDSRVNSTRVVGEAIAAAKRPPKLWLQAGTATIYSHRYDAPNDEETGIIGGDEPNVPLIWASSVAVAKSWERELTQADTPNTRRISLRMSMVMGPRAGTVFEVMAGLARWGLGGTAGNGRQYVAWIHEEDFVRAVEFLIAREDLEGAINVCSPNPLPNRHFNKILRQAVGAPFGLPVFEWMLEVGAVLMRTETELILKSRRVVPKRLLDAGFQFTHPEWPAAAHAIAGSRRLSP